MAAISKRCAIAVVAGGLTFSGTLQSGAPLPFSLPDIIGQSPDHVRSILGAPAKRETVKPSSTPCPCPKLTYRNGDVEIVYIRNAADWITINRVDQLPFRADSLGTLGLGQSRPDVDDANSISWHGVAGTQSVQFFPGTIDSSGHRLIDWIYIKAHTP